MTSGQERIQGSEAAQAIRVFLATYDSHDVSDRQIAARIRERLHRELYRRERDKYAEYVDLGGEA